MRQRKSSVMPSARTDALHNIQWNPLGSTQGEVCSGAKQTLNAPESCAILSAHVAPTSARHSRSCNPPLASNHFKQDMICFGACFQ